MIELPKGQVNLDNVLLIQKLINDPDFIASVEETEGKVRRIYADWKTNKLYYEFLDYTVKESKLRLTEIVRKLEEIQYLADYLN